MKPPAVIDGGRSRKYGEEGTRLELFLTGVVEDAEVLLARLF
jgi:hypothetical protein